MLCLWFGLLVVTHHAREAKAIPPAPVLKLSWAETLDCARMGSQFYVSNVNRSSRYFVPKQNEKFNITAANDMCKNFGGYLFEPDDAYEFDFVAAFIKKLGGVKRFYTGLNDLNNDKTFTFYTSGKTLTNKFPRWGGDGKEQPKIGDNRFCVAMSSSYDYELETWKCDEDKVKYICEMTVTEISYEYDWNWTVDVLGYDKNSIYFISKEDETFNITTAEETCDKIGGSLFEPNNQAEFDWIRDSLNTETVPGEVFFTGINDLDLEGLYSFKKSGRAFPDIKRWASGHPHKSKDHYDCVGLARNSSYLLVEMPCDLARSRFICETPAPKNQKKGDNRLVALNVKLAEDVPPLRSHWTRSSDCAWLESAFDVSNVNRTRQYLVTKFKEPFSITAANDTCKIFGGHLFEPDSMDEFEFVSTFLKNFIDEAKWFFTGAADVNKNGKFMLRTSGKIFPDNFPGWADKQPSKNVEHKRRCVKMNSGNNYKLEPSACDTNEEVKYICEVKVQETALEWIQRQFDFLVEHKSHFYFMTKLPGTFNRYSAEATCKSLSGGYLFEPDNEEELNIIATYVNKTGGAEHYFTGGKYYAKDREFRYLEGNNVIPSIHGWKSKQPRNKVNAQSCVEFYEVDGKVSLLSTHCDLPNSKFVCEVSPINKRSEEALNEISIWSTSGRATGLTAKVLAKQINELKEQAKTRESQDDEKIRFVHKMISDRKQTFKEKQEALLKKVEQQMNVTQCGGTQPYNTFTHHIDYAVFGEKCAPNPFLYSGHATSDGWMLIQRRSTGRTNFNRTWADYKHGFEEKEGDFWVGLQNMYSTIGDDKWEMIVIVGFHGETRHAHYSSFSVGDEDDGYRLKLGDYVDGSLKDDLRFHQNMMFSTWDSDKDLHNHRHCAQEFGSGWWYNNCGFVNLNGKDWKSPYQTHGIHWSSFTRDGSGEYSEMRIRKVA